ncbi:hypothetical protein OG21DRAFT_1512611 [Imleria badia]|nr:hypothetical protein OG21DRAFT_1512611 [Imleria badia]
MYPDVTSAVQQTALFPFLLASESISRRVAVSRRWLRGCVDVWDQASQLGKEVLPVEVDKDDSDGSSEKICKANLSVADESGEYSGRKRHAFRAIPRRP